MGPCLKVGLSTAYSIVHFLALSISMCAPSTSFSQLFTTSTIIWQEVHNLPTIRAAYVFLLFLIISHSSSRPLKSHDKWHIICQSYAARVFQLMWLVSWVTSPTLKPTCGSSPPLGQALHHSHHQHGSLQLHICLRPWIQLFPLSFFHLPRPQTHLSPNPFILSKGILTDSSCEDALK